MMFRNSATRLLSAANTRGVATMATSSKAANNSKWAMAAGIAAGAAYATWSVSSDKLRADTSPKTLLGDNEWVDLKVAEVHELSHNTKKLVFELPTKDHVLGLSTASAVLTKFTRENGKNVLRPYTPITPVNHKGQFELVVKRYENGLMSTHIHNLKPNDVLSFKGPLPKYQWSPNLHKEIALLGGGTGITPLFQVLQEIHNNPEDKTKVNLYYANVAEDDILIRNEIETLVNDRPEQFKVTYFLEKAPNGWKGEVGYITKEFLQKNLVKPTAGDIKVFVCGPPPFYKALSGDKVSPQDQGELTGALAELGYNKDQVYKF